MFDPSGGSAYLQAATGGATTSSGPPVPDDVVAALSGLTRHTLRGLASAGVLEPVESGDDWHLHYRGTPAVTAVAHALLVTVGVDADAAGTLVRPARAPEPDVARRAAAARRLIAGDVTPRELDAEVQVLPAAHLVAARVRVGDDERWHAVSRAHAELATFVRMHEMTPCGPVAVSVTDVADAEIGLEVSVPVEELVGSSGSVHPGHRPATQVAVARHLGDPLTRAVTGEALWRWLHGHGLVPNGLPIEVHVAPDRVDICWPVA